MSEQLRLEMPEEPEQDGPFIDFCATCGEVFRHRLLNTKFCHGCSEKRKAEQKSWRRQRDELDGMLDTK